MSARALTRIVLRVAPVLLVAWLLVPSPAFGDALTPESGGSPNADDIDTLYKITLYVAIVIFLIVEGTLIWSLVRHRARRGGPEAAQIRGNTPLEVGWTLGAALILVVLTVITFVYLDDIKNPPRSGPNGLASQSLFASIDQPAAARRRPDAQHRGERAAVPLALRLPGRASAVQLLRDGRAHGHHRHARHQRRRRDPLLVDPQARRQGRRRARPREQDLVQDPAEGRHDLQGPVRRALRRQPRGHARGGPRRHTRRNSRPGRSSSALTSRPPARRSASSARPRAGRTTRVVEPAAAAGRPARDRHARPGPIAGRLARVAHHHRPQEDRDHVPGAHGPLLAAGRGRGAPDPLAAGGAGQHADRPGDLQRPGLDARVDDDLPGAGAGLGRLRQLPRPADDRRARHGLPAPERALVLAAAVRGTPSTRASSSSRRRRAGPLRPALGRRLLARRWR